MAAEATFNQLAKAPGIGARYDSDDPMYAGLRYGLVSKFRNDVMFYRPTANGNGIEIVRVLHGARECESILEPSGNEDL